jgi:galactose-1-phosphate uridylyltransferase
MFRISTLIDRLCMAIYARGQRAYVEHRRPALEAERARSRAEAAERRAADDERRQAEDAAFASFQAVWPFDGTESPYRAKKMFLALSEEDRARAVLAAPAYLRQVQASRHRPMRASVWLQAFAVAA